MITSGILIDTETGGFSASKNGLTEIAACRFTIDGSWQVALGDSYNRIISPVYGKAYHPQALIVQGRTMDWLEQEGGDYREAVQGFYDYLVAELGLDYSTWGAHIWAHNAQFDHGFLYQAFSECLEFNPLPKKCDWNCTKALSSTLRKQGFSIPMSSSNKTLAEHFKIDATGQHSALVDVNISIQILSKLLRLRKKQPVF